MSESSTQTFRWIQLSVIVGLATCTVYPALVFLPLPQNAAAILAAAWGPLFGVASLGLAKLLQVERRSIAVQLAIFFNLSASVLITAMLLVQLAVGATAQDAKVAPELVAVWLGLDVAWDIYAGLGMALFALAMLSHPRFRLAFGASGLLIAGALLILNLFTFPTPPANAGLFDPGPLVGLWYLAVTIQTWRSLRWAKTRLTTTEASCP